MDDDALRAKLSEEMHQVDAAALLPHHRRGVLIIAAGGVDLVDAAVAVAADDAARVEQLVVAGELSKPTLADFAQWCMDPHLLFRFVIVQPYVLAQAMVQ